MNSLRRYLSDLKCFDRGGRCDCKSWCEQDAREDLASLATRLRNKIREIMRRAPTSPEGEDD